MIAGKKDSTIPALSPIERTVQLWLYCPFLLPARCPCKPYRRRERSVPAADRAHSLRKKPLSLKRDPVVPGFASHETLLCSPERKFCSNRVKMDEELNTNVRGLHCLGDSSGWTRGLMMASAMGVLMGRKLAENEA